MAKNYGKKLTPPHLATLRSASRAFRKKFLEIVFVLLRRKSRQGLDPVSLLDLNPHNRLLFRASLSQDGHGCQSFRVQFGDEIGVACPVLFPHLPNLDFANRHSPFRHPI